MKVSIIPGGRIIVRILVSYNERPPEQKVIVGVTWPSGKATQLTEEFLKMDWSPTYLAVLKLNGPLEAGTYKTEVKCGEESELLEFTIV